MSSEKLYSEILTEFDNAKTKQERVAILRREGDDRFKFFLQLIFNPAGSFAGRYMWGRTMSNSIAGLNINCKKNLKRSSPSRRRMLILSCFVLALSNSVSISE